jgi:hypothetical protein
MRYRLGLFGMSVALGASGCSLEDVDSDAIRTQGMFADMLALAPGNGSTLVRVDLNVGGENGTTVNLVGDDQLDASKGEVTEKLERARSGRYERQMEGDSAGAVSVELSRGPDDAAAGGSAELPEPFILQLETDASAGIDRGSDVVVSWAPSGTGATMHWALEGDCLWSESGDTADDGLLALGPDSFRVRATRVGEECEVQISVDRQNLGAVDGVWVPGSRFRAIQRRAVDVVSTPSPVELGRPSPDAG